jgi:hypothetical protein
VPAIERWAAAHLGVRHERWRLRLLYLLNGSRPEPLPAHRGPVEDPQPQRTGICCSGGGIRSAAFNLGALQQLQAAGTLQNADYLACVSGGSYIGAAFAMVAKTRSADGDDDSDPALIATCPPFAPGSPEEQYLRNRSQYMAPDSKAKVYLAFRIVLGLLLNLLFVSLPFFAATVLLGLLLYRHGFPALVTCEGASRESCTPPQAFHEGALHVPKGYWLIPVAMLALSAGLGLLAMIKPMRRDRNTRALQLWSTRLLVGAGVVALITVAVPELVYLFHAHGRGSGVATGTSTNKDNTVAAVGVGGLLAGVAATIREVFSDAHQAVGALAKLNARLRRAVAYAAAAILGPLLLFALVVFSMAFTLANSGSASARDGLLLGAAGAIALFALLYAIADITAISLHPFYKRRLCTAFALKRVRPRPAIDSSRAGSGAGATGAPIAADAQEFDQGIAVERNYDELVQLSATTVRAPWPTLLVCAAANVSEPGATPPGRHITSFTFSPESIGGPLVGAMRTTEFEQVFAGRNARGRDLTLPAAVAMSGAAIAPSMGKSASRSFTFLLALANIRLGVWVPNPRWVAGSTRTWRRPSPGYLLRELVGRNRVDSRYLFVTDGGHYENLGLVELLRRGCTTIYCFDASGGEFEALGDAVALARSELGVEIDIRPDPLMAGSGSSREHVQRAARKGESAAESPTETEDRSLSQQIAITATFTYRDGTKGRLIYAHNVMTREAKWDVRAHNRADPAFPHDSTGDQLFTDFKFESYRELGQQAGASALALSAGLDRSAPAGSSTRRLRPRRPRGTEGR